MAHEHPTYVELGYGGDFRLTGLAERLSSPGHRVDRASALAVVAELADGSDGEEAVELRVLRELEPEIAARAVSPLRHAVPGTAVLEALEQAVIRVDPDLGFRLCLRAVTELAQGTGTVSVRKP